VSDKTDKNQDSKPDLDPEDEVSILSDVDSLLAEEDPEFLQKMNEIEIEPDAVDLAGLDDVLGIRGHQQKGILAYLKKPFEFKSNPKIVIPFWLLVITLTSLVVFTWKNKSNLLHEDLFIQSLAALAPDVREFNPIDGTESFYDNPRFTKNLISISPMHLNIKPSENSGDNPMLAIQVTVEGLSSDAIVEVKDREAEFKDLLSRLTEEKTYDDLVDAEGKRSLTEQYREVLNANLTRGQVRRVLLKTFIIKP
jgi:flagellar basal body-associated protein FliL